MQSRYLVLRCDLEFYYLDLTKLSEIDPKFEKMNLSLRQGKILQVI